MLYMKLEDHEIVEITDNDNAADSYEAVDADDLDTALQLIESRDWHLDSEQRGHLAGFFESSNTDVLSAFDIKVSTNNRSFNELADMFAEGEIEISDVQRKFVWPSTKSSRLIESILLGIPIPPLFFMDKGDDRYEVIDGLQRLTTISNFILGNSWDSITNSDNNKKQVKARLAKNVDASIAGKTFEDLPRELQKKIKRAAVTVIDFRQINQDDKDAKYMIFERINTGSELLNGMQIRKALSYGPLIESLYDYADKMPHLKALFGKAQINKDEHIELLLSAYMTYQVLEGHYQIVKPHYKNILNDFCQQFQFQAIPGDFIFKFEHYLGQIQAVFGKNIFKKVNISGRYLGDMMTNISDVFMALLIQRDKAIHANIEERYTEELSIVPKVFSNTTLSNEIIDARVHVFARILGE